MYLPTYPTNRKKIKCLVVERRRRRAFWSSSIVSKHTCLSSAKRGRCDPPQSVPLQASSTDPISRRVNPSLVGRDFCRPSSTKEVPPPPTSSKILSSPAIPNLSSPSPPCRGVSLGIPRETASQWKRNEDKRITSVLISPLPREPRILLPVPRGDTSIIYTSQVVQLYKQSGTRSYTGECCSRNDVVHRLPALLRLLFEINFSRSYCLFHFDVTTTTSLLLPRRFCVPWFPDCLKIRRFSSFFCIVPPSFVTSPSSCFCYSSSLFFERRKLRMNYGTI